MENKDNDSGKKPKKRGKKVIKWSKIAIIVGVVTLVLLTVVGAYKDTVVVSTDMEYTAFQELVKSGQVEKVNIVNSAETFIVTLNDGTRYTVINPKHPEFRKEIMEMGVKVEVQKVDLTFALFSTLSTLPMLILSFMLVMYVMRYLGESTSTVFKMFKPEEIIGFDAVAGMSSIKEEVRFAVNTLQNHSRLKELGARPTKGIILEGPPGNGKTLIAKAIAGEAGVPFISTSGADFVEMFVGLGAARVRSLWSLAILNAPCVIFIDEIDAVGRRRSERGSNSESNQTLNALLQKMDGLDTNTGILVIGATNLIGDLDSALLRPGRFDKHIYIGPSTSKADRDEIIELYLKTKQCERGVTVSSISKEMFGFTGAEIETTLNEAVIHSLMRGGDGVITCGDVASSAMKLRTSGTESRHSSSQDLIIAATHEAGHAVMASMLKHKVAKVSIAAYTNGVGGVTVQDTDRLEDRKFKTVADMANDILILLSGQAAEGLLLGTTSNGCSNDIEIANQIAFKMVNDYAMIEDYMINTNALRKIGAALDDDSDVLPLMSKLLSDSRKCAVAMLKERMDDIIKLRDRLLEYETIIDYNMTVLPPNENSKHLED